MPKIKSKNYEDVTEKWISNKKSNNKNIELQMYYEDSGKYYYVDNKKVVMDYSKKELEVAHWLSNTFNERVIILPKVNYPENIKIPDYIFKGEKWDLKELKNAKSNNRSIDNIIKDNKNQSSNFVIDVNVCRLDKEIFIKQIDKIFENQYRKWLKKIILKRNNNLIGVYIRK